MPIIICYDVKASIYFFGTFCNPSPGRKCMSGREREMRLKKEQQLLLQDFIQRIACRLDYRVDTLWRWAWIQCKLHSGPSSLWLTFNERVGFDRQCWNQWWLLMGVLASTLRFRFLGLHIILCLWCYLAVWRLFACTHILLMFFRGSRIRELWGSIFSKSELMKLVSFTKSLRTRKLLILKFWACISFAFSLWFWMFETIAFVTISVTISRSSVRLHWFSQF